MNKLRSSARGALVWIAPFALLVLLLAWQTDWGRAFARTPAFVRCRCATRPIGSGRRLVRSITASRSRSIHWLSTLALAATMAVPRQAQRTFQISRALPTATIAMTTVSKIMIRMRGLVSSM